MPCRKENKTTKYNTAFYLLSEGVRDLNPLIHRHSPPLRVLHHLQSLLLQEFLLLGFGDERHTMGLGVVVFIKIGESGEAVGGDFFGLAAAVHFCVNRQGAAPGGDYLALESDNVTCENRELEIDAMEDKKDSVFRVNILRHSEIRTFQKILGATTCEESLVMVEVGEFD